MFDSWKRIKAMSVKELPDNMEMERQAPYTWDADVVAPGGRSEASSSGIYGVGRKQQAKAKAKAVDDPEKGGMYNTHEACMRLMSEGALPKTTKSQRQRQCRASGSGHAVPEAFRWALQHGYISPNLPAPDGFIWRCRASTWKLSRLGG